MDGVLVDISKPNSCFVISGNTILLSSNRRIRTYFESFLQARFAIDDTVVVPFGVGAEENVLKALEKTFLRHNIGSRLSDLVKKDLKDFVQQEEDFIESSVKARSIWENNITPSELKDFTDALQLRLSGRTLYDRQLLAALHLAHSQNACNFSVPGAGKTSVVYGAFSYLSGLPESSSKHVNKLVVIGPLSSFGPWEMEFEECFSRKAKSMRLAGSTPIQDRERHLLSTLPDVANRELTLLTYQSLPGLYENLVAYCLRPENRVMLVLDEAHRIKNTQGGIWAETALNLAKYCRSRVVLTGTPAPNGYQDLFNLFRFIWPHKDVIGFSPGHLAEMSDNKRDPRIERLKDNVCPYFVRITKNDLGIPPAIENEPILVKMGDEQRLIYDFIEHSYLSPSTHSSVDLQLKDEFKQARLIRLMQVASNPSLLTKPIERMQGDLSSNGAIFFEDSEIASRIRNYCSVETPAKLVKLGEMVSKKVAAGEKLIIWAVYVQNLEQIKAYLDGLGISSELLYGATPSGSDDEGEIDLSTREAIINRFHRSDCPYKVLVANPFAVGESISLHKACHSAIYYERNFSAGAFVQSKDRIHRYGLAADIETNYYYLISENSIDEVIHRRLEEKIEAMLEVVESREIPLLSQNMDYQDDDDDFKAVIRAYVERSSRG